MAIEIFRDRVWPPNGPAGTLQGKLQVNSQGARVATSSRSWRREQITSSFNRIKFCQRGKKYIGAAALPVRLLHMAAIH